MSKSKPGLKGGARRDYYESEESSVEGKEIRTSLDPGIYDDKKGYSRTPSTGTGVTVETTDSRKLIFGKDENEDRGNWSGRFDFLLSLLGYAVGLGNVWRFPYLCYRNGGGAFLIPFVLMMGLIGVPLFFMEASLGQFCSSGPMTCWKFAPMFKGVGIAMVLVSGFTSLYYNMILAWSYYYLFVSFTSDLPWADCYNPEWNTEFCADKLPLIDCTTTKYLNGTCYNGDQFLGLWNDTMFTEVTGHKRISAAEEYWTNRAINMSSGIDDFGQPKWQLVMCLMLAWIICFLCLMKGIKTTGKVVYFTAIFPFVVLIILFFRGVTLDNAGQGIYYFIVPDFDRLLDAQVWKDAAVQIFFSMSIAGGGLVTLASYNRFHNNILKDSIIVCVGDTLTCIFAGFVIFSFLGYMAGRMNLHVKDVARDGAGLAFVVYPEAVTSMPGAPFWSILFFLMLITLGLDSQFAMLETVLTGVTDQWPHLRQHKTIVILIICSLFFLAGLPLTCPGGIYLLQILDNYVGGWTLLLIGFAECMCLTYAYGVTRFMKDIEVMLGFKISVVWKVLWMVISPLVLMFIFVFTFVDYESSTYGDYKFPGWADGIGWFLAVMMVIPIPIVILYKIGYADSYLSVKEKLSLLTSPSDEWGPALVKHRKLVTYADDWVLDPWAERGAYLNKGYSTPSTYASSRASSIYSIPGFKAKSTGELSEAGISRITSLTFESTV
ncbi:sodium-dependent proline transporter-like [Mytilus trossulus]|uniref:sodium-dependent proline transporter-like n=1 Tax=Mytilus trossulus TaxID=6551 RepID=UPI00300602B0